MILWRLIRMFLSTCTSGSPPRRTSLMIGSNFDHVTLRLVTWRDRGRAIGSFSSATKNLRQNARETTTHKCRNSRRGERIVFFGFFRKPNKFSSSLDVLHKILNPPRVQLCRNIASHASDLRLGITHYIFNCTIQSTTLAERNSSRFKFVSAWIFNSGTSSSRKDIWHFAKQHESVPDFKKINRCFNTLSVCLWN